MPEMDSPRNSDPRTIYRVIFLMPWCQNMSCWVFSTKHEYLSAFCTRPLRAQPSRLKIDENLAGSLGAIEDFSQLRQRILDLSSALRAGSQNCYAPEPDPYRMVKKIIIFCSRPDYALPARPKALLSYPEHHE